jgi:hypothetical protein
MHAGDCGNFPFGPAATCSVHLLFISLAIFHDDDEHDDDAMMGFASYPPLDPHAT